MRCSSRVFCGAVAISVAVLGSAPSALGVGGGAGASGSGDEIISSILAATSNVPSSSRARGVAPRCFTRVLTDEQVIYLFHVAATMPELLTAAFLDAIDNYSNANIVSVQTPPQPPPDPESESESEGAVAEPGTEPDARPLPPENKTSLTYWELTVRICDGVADTMSVVSRTVTDESVMAATMARGTLSQTTRLPAPTVEMSPPPPSTGIGTAARTIVGEPVFLSTSTRSAVTARIDFGGRTVEVEAQPAAISVFSGQPSDVGDTQDCSGLGVPYDPDAPESPGEQARLEGRCVLHFEQATGVPRRPHWSGYVQLNWTGHYRIDGGGWRPLDGLFSMSPVNVAVDEVDTAIRG